MPTGFGEERLVAPVGWGGGTGRPSPKALDVGVPKGHCLGSVRPQAMAFPDPQDPVAFWIIADKVRDEYAHQKVLFVERSRCRVVPVHSQHTSPCERHLPDDAVLCDVVRPDEEEVKNSLSQDRLDARPLGLGVPPNSRWRLRVSAEAHMAGDEAHCPPCVHTNPDQRKGKERTATPVASGGMGPAQRHTPEHARTTHTPRGTRPTSPLPRDAPVGIAGMLAA